MTGVSFPLSISLRLDHPDFLDLPWHLPLSEWSGQSGRLEEVPRGLSRHPVVFVNYSGALYALKEMPKGQAEKEYNRLLEMEDQRLPAVTPVGHVQTQLSRGPASVLITRYLDRSLPYRSLFMQRGLMGYREHLLDAIAGLLVQLHLVGVFWGDCSLSNTLFRRDAGALQAYLVDAETAEIDPENFSPRLRFHDLEIMEENVDAELLEMVAGGLVSEGIPIYDTGANIRLRYQSLWEEITREEVINPGERYRIQERIRALNSLGFSIGEVKLEGSEGGEQLRLRVFVTDRNFHRDQLFGLTGIEAEEMQARKMVNEIHEIKAILSQVNNRSTPLGVAAFHWLENRYQPVTAALKSLADQTNDFPELYCQLLEHKWYLSEKAQRDVGHEAAVEDYLQQFGGKNED
jgi:Domain of unknown function (DUF4032)/Lipopolysaccharide kinase (Kdo/WaaP) family